MTLYRAKAAWIPNANRMLVVAAWGLNGSPFLAGSNVVITELGTEISVMDGTPTIEEGLVHHRFWTVQHAGGSGAAMWTCDFPPDGGTLNAYMISSTKPLPRTIEATMDVDYTTLSPATPFTETLTVPGVGSLLDAAAGDYFVGFVWPVTPSVINTVSDYWIWDGATSTGAIYPVTLKSKIGITAMPSEASITVSDGAGGPDNLYLILAVVRIRPVRAYG